MFMAAIWGFTAAVSMPGAREEAFECMEEVVLSWEGGDEITFNEPSEPDEDSAVCWAEDVRERTSSVLSFAMGNGLPDIAPSTPIRPGMSRVVEPTPNVRSDEQLEGFPTQALSPPPIA